MKIISNDGKIDFEAPIYMTDEQRLRFIKRIKQIFENVKILQVREQVKEMGELERHPKKWKIKDLVLAASALSNEEVAKRTGREIFSVQMKRGSWLMELQTWARKRGLSEITEDDIKEFERSR